MSQKPFPISLPLRKLASVVTDAGGTPFVVGGAVRDFVMDQREPKDVDVEVYGVDGAVLQTVLERHFHVDAVGKAFGVLKVVVEGETFDVSLPRSENKEGRGHRGFIVTTNPNLTPWEACQRRDLTINTLMVDLTTGQVLEPVAGALADLDGKVLRAVSPAFAEDPLRVLRVCQFAARFEATVEEGTVALCQSLVDEMRSLPTERFWEEFKKLFLKSKKPSRGLEVMREVGALSLFPELEALVGVSQDPTWHPEGCVWTHNNMVVDAAVRVLDEDSVTDEEQRLVVLLGALCHDLGKPLVTEFKEGKDGPRWRAHDHEEQGVGPTRAFLARIGCTPSIVEQVVPIVASHLKPFQMYRDRASASAIRRLALKVNMTQLCRVARADFLGRTTPDAMACTDSREISDTVWFMEQASKLKVALSAPAPIVMGRHLLERGFVQGPKMGATLKELFQRQLDGEFEDITGGLEVLERMTDLAPTTNG